MSYIGGDIIEITYNHPVIGSGTLYCKSNEDGTIDPGGYRTNDDANQVTGDGKMIVQLNRVLARFEAPPIAWDMTGADELFKLKDMAASPVNADWTINHVSGSIWGGKGRPVGDIQAATNSAQVTLILAFENELKKLS